MYRVDAPPKFLVELDLSTSSRFTFDFVEPATVPAPEPVPSETASHQQSSESSYKSAHSETVFPHFSPIRENSSDTPTGQHPIEFHPPESKQDISPSEIFMPDEDYQQNTSESQSAFPQMSDNHPGHRPMGTEPLDHGHQPQFVLRKDVMESLISSVFNSVQNNFAQQTSLPFRPSNATSPP